MKKTITLIPLFFLLHATFGAAQEIPEVLGIWEGHVKGI